MTQEEKARAYDEALEKAKEFKNNPFAGYDGTDLISALFPEPREESEDERIKHAIKVVLANTDLSQLKVEYTFANMLAWLEKQGELVEINPTEFDTRLQALIARFGGLPKEELIGSLSFWTNVVQNDGTYTEEKQGEQKPTNKVEPKFKNGQWIVFNGLTLYVKEVVKGFYRTISKGGITNSYDWDIDNVARLWTIQEAKNGDVLFMDNGTANCIFIYKSFNNGIINKYASYNNFGFEGEHYLVLNDGYVIPATKEQCDLLFQKMKEASYVWDDEKKELRKIKHDVQLTEFEHALKDMMNTYRDAIGDNDVTIEEVKERAKYMLSLINPKSAWGEEDEHWRQKAVDFIKHPDLIKATPTLAKNTIDWLKSIRPHSQWKPSEEQLKSLQEVIDVGHFTSYPNALETLYEQLKQL